jgi:hypothetical protein
MQLPLVGRHVASFHLDANRINVRQQLPDINQLEAWDRAGVVSLELSIVARDEVLRTGHPAYEQKALRYLATETLADTSDERRLVRQIAAILFPGGLRTAGERNDVLIVFNAYKYCAYLVTADGGSKNEPGGILGHAAALRALNIRVMPGQEAVASVRERIAVRDRSAMFRHERLGHPLPEWVGGD